VILPWLVLAVLIGLIAFLYLRDRQRFMARVAQGSRVLDSPYGRIEYAVRGEGPAVLAIHGTGGGFDQSLDLGEALVTRGFRVIAPSRFGYLGSGFPADASPTAQADALAHLVHALGEQRVAVIGASAGAPSALAFARRHPELCAGLVLLVPAAYAPGRVEKELPLLARVIIFRVLRWDFLFWAWMKLAPSTLIRTLLATDPRLVLVAAPDEQARARMILDHILPVSRRVAGMFSDAEISARPKPFPLADIKVPALAVACEDDLFDTHAAARHAAANIPGARLMSFPTGGHIWIGHHAEVFNGIAEFLRSLRWGVAPHVIPVR